MSTKAAEPQPNMLKPSDAKRRRSTKGKRSEKPKKADVNNNNGQKPKTASGAPKMTHKVAKVDILAEKTAGKCKFGTFGCDYKVRPVQELCGKLSQNSDIPSHVDKEPIYHLAILNDYVLGFKRVLFKMAEQINQTQEAHDSVGKNSRASNFHISLDPHK